MYDGVRECVAAQSLMLLLVGLSLLRHRAGQVEEEGASMEMPLLSWRHAATPLYVRSCSVLETC